MIWYRFTDRLPHVLGEDGRSLCGTVNADLMAEGEPMAGWPRRNGRCALCDELLEHTRVVLRVRMPANTQPEERKRAAKLFLVEK